MKQKAQDFSFEIKGKHLSKFAKAMLGGGLALVIFGASATAYAAVPTLNSAKITGASTVTFVFSEPVTTKILDYSAFTGALNGQSVYGMTGSGSATIVLTLNDKPFNASATAGLTLSANTVSLSDNSPFAAGAVSITDGQPPVLNSLAFGATSNSSDTGMAKIGDTLNLTFTASEPINLPSVTINGHLISSVSGNGSGPYTVSYTIGGSDNQGQGAFVINMSDTTGNAAPAFSA